MFVTTIDEKKGHKFGREPRGICIRGVCREGKEEGSYITISNV